MTQGGVQALPPPPNHRAHLVSSSEPLALRARCCTWLGGGKGGEEAGKPGAQGSTLHARLPHARGLGLTRERKASTSPPPSFPPRCIQGGLATSLYPKPSLRFPRPFSPSVHLPSQRAHWPPASPLICFLDGPCAVCLPTRLSACLLVVRLLMGQVGCPSVCQSIHRASSLFHHQVYLSVLPMVSLASHLSPPPISLSVP